VTEATEPTEESEESSEDESLNSDAERVRSLDRVEAFIQRERWHEVVTGLQTLIESPDDTFTRGPQGNWMSLHDAIQRRLESLPETGRRLYEEVYAATAADLLEQARRSGDLDRVADISRRFSNTDAGQQALVQLALLAYDRGELLAAARWFDRLSPEQLAGLSAPVSLKYAHALKVEGREERARELFESAAARSPGETRLETWWRQVEQPGFLPTPRSDWPQSYGDASHAAAAAGGEPLLSPEWRMPMTFVHSVAGQVESLTQDLRDAGRACLPAMFPVTAGGKAAVRTLRGLQVIDIATGESVWEQKLEEASPERLLSGLAVDAGIANHHRIRVMNGARYGEMGEPDQHPLTNLLYRDAVFGTLATDGEQLFALDEHAVLGRTNSGYLWAQEKEVDPFGRDWTCNRLVSYDLETGRELWRVGGPRRQEPFDLPLAGTYFFGAPTIVGDELFVIGERDSEVSLHVLERRTGRPIYSQPLANSTANIEVDMARRFWACQPAVSQGVVVCPTTAGWVVAVDRTQRRLLWAYGYGGGDTEHRQRRFGGLMVHPLHPLGTRWAWAPPVVVGNRVFITPQELPDATTLARRRSSVSI
jgi:outer membrane protein assembly factor BamB